MCGATRTEQYSITDAIKDAVGKITDKIKEWIEKIFGGSSGDTVIPDDPDTPDGPDTPDTPDTLPVELSVTLSKTSFTYNGKVQKPEVTSVKAGDTELEPSEYSVTYSDDNSKDAGEYSVDVSLSGESYSIDEITGIATYTIKKAANLLAVSGKTATVKRKNLKKKAQTVAAASVMDVRGAKGSVTYSLIGVQKAKYRKYFSVNAYTGNVTVKKKLRKGTYTLTVNVKAAGNNNYNAASKNVVYRIKIK